MRSGVWIIEGLGEEAEEEDEMLPVLLYVEVGGRSSALASRLDLGEPLLWKRVRLLYLESVHLSQVR